MIQMGVFQYVMDTNSLVEAKQILLLKKSQYNMHLIKICISFKFQHKELYQIENQMHIIIDIILKYIHQIKY